METNTTGTERKNTAGTGVDAPGIVPDAPDDPELYADLSTRTRGALRVLGCRTVEEIAAITTMDVMRTPNAGRKTVNELKCVLAAQGLRFADDLKIAPPSEIDLLAKAFAALAAMPFAARGPALEYLTKRLLPGGV